MSAELSEIQASTRRSWTRRAVLRAAACAALAPTMPPIVAQATTPGLRPPVVFDPMTALAIDGFDPVAYFTDGAPRLGLPNYEIRDGRLFWRFLNEGNMAAFRADPDIYEPVFGGYCPYALSRRLPTPGNPQIFEIHEGRLYFFFSSANRLGFRKMPGKMVADAAAHWPEMRGYVVGRG